MCKNARLFQHTALWFMLILFGDKSRAFFMRRLWPAHFLMQKMHGSFVATQIDTNMKKNGKPSFFACKLY